METKQEHSISGSPVISLKKRMTYDHAGRLIKSEEQLNKTDWITVNELKYNEKGELISKKLYSADGTNFLQEVNYDYNIRGWMTFINNPENLGTDFFAVQLKYENGQTPQYNGNISEIIWADSAFTEQKGYTFTYDGINRLTTANYTDAQKYNTAYQYDFNGNILTLNRNGQTDELTNSYGNIDNLSYAYSGNQLLKVDDTEISENQENGFTDNGSFEDIEYLYDANGNMIKDFNKDIDSVSYNHLNLPERIEVSGNGSLNIIYYTYDAAGIKLNKYADYSNGYDKTTDYVGNFIYENDQLKYIITDYGKITTEINATDTIFTRQYNLTDHLGNVRVTFNVKSDSTADIVQEDSYYPFGMTMNGLNYQNVSDEDKNLYLYNGKELQEDFGLDWYDYGARFYDAQLGRWHVPDAFASDAPAWSPYRYGFNNPISITDPDGNFEDGYTVDKDGYIKRVDDTGGDKYDVLYTKEDYEKAKASGKTNSYGNPEPKKSSGKIYNKSILSNLKKLDSDNRSISKSNSSGSIDDVFKIFNFVAKNTEVEWAVSRYKEKNINKYAIFTDHEADEVSDPTTHGLNNVISMVHNHTYNGTDVYTELNKMGQHWNPFTKSWQVFRNSDVGNIVSGDKSFILYTYYPTSKRLYHASKKGAKEIKKINNYKDFYFGTLNHK